MPAVLLEALANPVLGLLPEIMQALQLELLSVVDVCVIVFLISAGLSTWKGRVSKALLSLGAIFIVGLADYTGIIDSSIADVSSWLPGGAAEDAPAVAEALLRMVA